MESINFTLAKKITTALQLIVLVAGGILTAWGMSQSNWPQALPWSGSGFVMYVSFIGLCSVLVAAGCIWTKWNAFAVGAVISIFLAVVSGVVWSLIVVCWYGLASAVLGRAVNVALGLELKAENWAMHLLVGAGIYGTAVGLFAHFPVSYPGIYGVLLALPLLLWWRSAADCFNVSVSLILQTATRPTRTNWLSIAIAVVALIHFVVALMPELGHDALAMHLFIPAHMASRHQWGFDPGTYVWAVMPMLGDWMFSLTYILSGETSVRILNVSFIFLLGWLVRDLVLLSGGTARGARWAVLIFLSTPLTFTESSSLFIESVWSVYIVAAVLALLQILHSSDNARVWLAFLASFLGFAAATKAVTLAILPIFVLFMSWKFKIILRQINFMTVLKVAALFLAIGLIPYSTSWVLTGNPVFPFFNGIFQSPYYPAVNFDSSVVFGKGLTWDILYRATFDSGKYLEATMGASGFQWLLLFLPASIFLLAKDNPRGVSLLLIGVLIVAVVFQSVSYLRYAFPALAILAAVIGIGLDQPQGTQNHFTKVVWGAGALSAVMLNLLFLSAGSPYRDFPIVSILDKTYRHVYLLGRLPLRNAVDAVNQINIGRSPVAVFAHPLTAGISSDALYSNWYNFGFQSDVNAAGTVDAIGKLLVTRGVDFVILDSNWSGGPEKRELITNATDKIADYGSVSIRKVRSEFRFKTELLKNAEFTSVEGWLLAPGASYSATTQAVTVSVAASATQSVPIESGGRYRNSIVARCHNETALGRVQINWLDRKGRFIRADIKTFECTSDWSEHTMDVTPPVSAAVAIVYSSGHTETPIEIRRNSLRQ